MENLRKELEILNETFIKKYHLSEINVDKTLAEVKMLADISFNDIKKENIEDKEEEFKRTRFAIKNILNSIFQIREYLDEEKIKTIAEEIAKEYLK